METKEMLEELQQPAKKNGSAKMVIVPIKASDKLKDDEGGPLTTLSLIKLLQHVRKPDGMTTFEMRSFFKALDKVEAAGESTVLEFEVSEAKIILDLLRLFKFTMADRFFMDFEDSLL
jgi:hypothetical protein